MRRCTLCDGTYEAGEYGQHKKGHTPIRHGNTRHPELMTGTVRAMVGSGLSQSETARRLGISRQRVHQIMHPDPLGRAYRYTLRGNR